MRLPTRLRVRAGLLTAAVLLAGVTGCAGLDEAAAAQGSSGGDLVSEAAGQLGASATLAYVASYRLAGGGTATISQGLDPVRVSYDYPGGRVITTPGATTSCAPAEGPKARCTVTEPLEDGSPQPAGLFEAAGKAGMVTPAAVLALLNAAALDGDASVTQHDTTIAGHHATCVVRDGTAGFTACITAEGLLGSFTGTVGGNRVDVALTHYSGTVRTEAFATPDGAVMIDRRGK